MRFSMHSGCFSYSASAARRSEPARRIAGTRLGPIAVQLVTYTDADLSLTEALGADSGALAAALGRAVLLDQRYERADRA